MTTKHWRDFERLVAALHVLQSAGADVRWNDHIGGRQFDVTVRFRHGFYSYLAVIECRRTASPVEAGEVEAFVTKSGDAGADKAIMVAAAGYQSGAVKVAERHHVELFRLEEIRENWPETVFEHLEVPGLNIYNLEVRRPGETTILRMPDISSYIERVTLHPPHSPIGLSVADTAHLLFPLNAKDAVQRQYEAAFHDPWLARLPDLPDPVAIGMLRLKARWVRVRVRLKAVLPPELKNTRYRVTDVMGKGVHEVAGNEIPIGFDTRFEAGLYFRDIENREYYCESVDSGKRQAVLVLLASRQFGGELYARLVIDTCHQALYVPVKAGEDVARLEGRYRVFKQAEAEGKTRRDGIPLLEKGAILVPAKKLQK